VDQSQVPSLVPLSSCCHVDIVLLSAVYGTQIFVELDFCMLLLLVFIVPVFIITSSIEFILFIYDLFNDTISSSHIASNDRIMSE
jgi:hypothetical protein